MPEKFDFSKPKDQKQFEALPKKAKEVLIEHAHEEAKDETFLNKLRERLGFSPEREIKIERIQVGGKTKDQLKQELNAKNIDISNWAEGLLDSRDFVTLQNTKNVKLVLLTVGDIGFPNGATTDEIYKRANKLGLDLCLAEVGPHFRLQYTGKEWAMIAMKQILDLDGTPSVFSLHGVGDQLNLDENDAEPDRLWASKHPWVFSIRKLES